MIMMISSHGLHRKFFIPYFPFFFRAKRGKHFLHIISLYLSARSAGTFFLHPIFLHFSARSVENVFKPPIFLRFSARSAGKKFSGALKSALLAALKSAPRGAPKSALRGAPKSALESDSSARSAEKIFSAVL